MKTEIAITLNHDEVAKTIPYAMICETRFGKSWDTMRRKRRWVEEFSENERKACRRLFDLSRIWYLVKGVPEEVKMSPSTYELWGKLADFCASL